MPVGACERAFLEAAALDGIALSRYKVPAINRRGHFGLPNEAASAFEALDKIFHALEGKPAEQCTKTPTPLPGDFIHSSTSTIIEIDEHQHFTTYRRRTFAYYPATSTVNYDLGQYEEMCETWSPKADAYFRTKYAAGFGVGGRQRQRAYNDALRDLVLPLIGYQPIIRVPAVHGDGARAYQENRDRMKTALAVG